MKANISSTRKGIAASGKKQWTRPEIKELSVTAGPGPYPDAGLGGSFLSAP